MRSLRKNGFPRRILFFAFMIFAAFAAGSGGAIPQPNKSRDETEVFIEMVDESETKRIKIDELP